MSRKWFVIPVCVVPRAGSARARAGSPVTGASTAGCSRFSSSAASSRESEFGELKKLEVGPPQGVRSRGRPSTIRCPRWSRVSPTTRRRCPTSPATVSASRPPTASSRSPSVGASRCARPTPRVRTRTGTQNDKDLQDISVQRARLWFKGHAFDPNLKYEIQFDVVGGRSRAADTTVGNAFDSAEHVAEPPRGARVTPTSTGRSATRSPGTT